MANLQVVSYPHNVYFWVLTPPAAPSDHGLNKPSGRDIGYDKAASDYPFRSSCKTDGKKQNAENLP